MSLARYIGSRSSAGVATAATVPSSSEFALNTAWHRNRARTGWCGSCGGEVDITPAASLSTHQATLWFCNGCGRMLGEEVVA